MPVTSGSAGIVPSQTAFALDVWVIVATSLPLPGFLVEIPGERRPQPVHHAALQGRPESLVDHKADRKGAEKRDYRVEPGELVVPSPLVELALHPVRHLIDGHYHAPIETEGHGVNG